MPQVIGTNVLSLNAQRNLNSSGKGLATSLQRLSSGLRINSAKDDAAGLAISNRMTAQIRGLNQAARNANDGISLAQTAEGDLAAVTNALQRIRELAVQSANATNSTTDRQALQAEASQLIAEIDRVAVASSFNGVKLLDGTFTAQQFQVGANANQTITVSSVASARTADLGQANNASVTSTAVAGALSTGDLTINGNAVAATSRDAAAIAAAITAASTDVTATATNTQTIAFGDATSATVQTATTATLGGAYTPAVSAAAAAVANASAVSSTFTTAVAAGGQAQTYAIDVDGTNAFSFTSTANTASSTLASGAWTDATASAGAGGTYTLTVDGTTAASITDAANTAASTTTTGAFTTVNLGAGDTYSLVVDGQTIYTETDGGGGTATVTAAEIQAALVSAPVTTALSGAGITVSGTDITTGDIVFSRADGTAFNVVVTNDAGANGFAGADFATGTNANTNAGTAPGSVTAAEVDAQVTANTAALNAAGITVAGTATAGTLTFSRADGEAFNVNIANSYGTPGGFTASADFDTVGANAASINGTAADDVTAAEIDAGITANSAALTAAGITVSGTATAGTLAFTKADGTAFNIVITNTFTAPAGDTNAAVGGFAGGNFATGTNAINNGSIEVTDTDFSLTLDGTQVYFEAATAGATATAAELDAALVTYVGNSNGAYTIDSGSIATGDLVLSKADGSAINLAIATNFTGTAGQLNGSSSLTASNGVTAANATAAAYNLDVDGNVLDFTTDGADGTVTGAEAAGLINALSGYTASFTGGNLTVTKADGSNIVLTESGADSAGAEGFAAASQTLYGTVTVTANNTDLVIGGAGVANAGLTAGTTVATTSGVTVAATDISTVSGANDAIVSIDAALDTVNSSRGDLGAIQSRFESVVSSLSTTAENLSSARSRIQDADFAAETAALTKSQILQQAGISILAQANSQPQLVLSLLQ